MKKPVIIVLAMVLGIIASNMLMSNKENNITAQPVEDTIQTKQAASIPL